MYELGIERIRKGTTLRTERKNRDTRRGIWKNRLWTQSNRTGVQSDMEHFPIAFLRPTRPPTRVSLRNEEENNYSSLALLQNIISPRHVHSEMGLLPPLLLLLYRQWGLWVVG